MYTYQMVGLADQNNRTYVSKYGSYSKNTGFLLKNFDISVSELITKLFHEDCWSLAKPVISMTKEEIEQELGYKIELVNENRNIDDKDLYKSQKPYYDDIFSLLFK